MADILNADMLNNKIRLGDFTAAVSKHKKFNLLICLKVLDS